MTPDTIFRRIGAALVSAVATALVFTIGLWMQHTRSGWPFDAPIGASHPGATASTEPAAASMNTHSRVPVDATAVGALDIRLETVSRASLAQTVRAVATIVPDESRISHVHTRVAGWIERLDVNTTGEAVREGQPLARIFSQELLSSQAEYLAARRNTAASGITSSVLASGRARLGVLGMAADEIAAIEAADEPNRLVTVVAPRSGVVVNRGVAVGTAVDPSTTLLTLADLSRVWVLAEVPEDSITAVRVGTLAELDFPASGRSPFLARVEFVYPMLTDRTRTLRVRFSADNARGALRPGLYGTASFASVGQRVLTVPRDAVIDTGLQQHVFVATGAQFEPRPVIVGTQLADRVEIREGLREGERIVAAGVFLLDSESRLRATGGTGGHNHGAPMGTQDAPTTPNPDPHAGHSPSVDPHAAHRLSSSTAPATE